MRHWKKKPWVDSEVRNWDYIADHLAPDASSADAGKVLTVGETGKPVWGEAGGSGGDTQFYIVQGTFDEEYTLSIDKSYTEIVTAMQSGQMVILSCDGLILPLISLLPDDSANFSTVSFIGYDSGQQAANFSVTQVIVASDDTLTENFGTFSNSTYTPIES